MSAKSFDQLVAAARAEVEDSGTVTIQLANDVGEPRFELFHFSISLCSQKVRAMLTEKGIPYRSNEVSLGSPRGNYLPGYVRLRMFAGGHENMARLATEHTMRTSLTTEGFDACVVPLLIDHSRRQAIVDSAEILEHIEREVPDHPMIPNDRDRAKAVRNQVAINDGIPHPGILYGFHANDPRPDFQIARMQNIYDDKCTDLEILVAENHNDPELVRVYEAKIAKEMAGKRIQRDPKYMKSILDEFRQIMADLDANLTMQNEGWLCGPEFTIADAIWGISLYRIQWLGHASLWDPHPRIRDYAYRLYDRPSLRKAVINWPTPQPPSPHTLDVLVG